jgi:hypothetical protein
MESNLSVTMERISELVKNERKPLTSWEVAIRIGQQPSQHIGVLLDKLAEDGKLAKFRAGTNRYYAVPDVALTERSPSTPTAIADSFRGAFITACMKVARR